jgi:hypothetical protein
MESMELEINALMCGLMDGTRLNKLMVGVQNIEP